jgi:hypothetical protein
MTRRTSITLEPEDERSISEFTAADSADHAALTEWAAAKGVDPARLTSEASVVRTLLRAGMEALREHVMQEGYAAMAASLRGEDRAETRTARDRYIERSERVAGE